MLFSYNVDLVHVVINFIPSVTDSTSNIAEIVELEGTILDSGHHINIKELRALVKTPGGAVHAVSEIARVIITV